MEADIEKALVSTPEEARELYQQILENMETLSIAFTALGSVVYELAARDRTSSTCTPEYLVGQLRTMTHLFEVYNLATEAVLCECDDFHEQRGERQQRRYAGMLHKQALVEESVKKLQNLLNTPDPENIKAWMSLCMELAGSADTHSKGSAAWTCFDAGFFSFEKIEKQIMAVASEHPMLKLDKGQAKIKADVRTQAGVLHALIHELRREQIMRRMLLEIKEAHAALSAVESSHASSHAGSCRIAAISKDELMKISGEALESLYKEALAQGDPTVVVDTAHTLSPHTV